MPDPDRTAPEPMDAAGTRATPEPDEHPGHERPSDTSLELRARALNKINPDEGAAAEGGTGTSGSRGGGPAADFSEER
jgi:hypothetical protein